MSGRRIDRTEYRDAFRPAAGHTLVWRNTSSKTAFRLGQDVSQEIQPLGKVSVWFLSNQPVGSKREKGNEYSNLPPMPCKNNAEMAKTKGRRVFFLSNHWCHYWPEANEKLFGSKKWPPTRHKGYCEIESIQYIMSKSKLTIHTGKPSPPQPKNV